MAVLTGAGNLRNTEWEPKGSTDRLVDHAFCETLASALPGYELRPQQLEMAQLVAAGLREEKHVVAEAGTGTGKSLAYLVPALYWAYEHGAKVIVSTGTIALQEQLIYKDIPFLREHLDVPFTAELAKGKANYLCLLRLDERLEEQKGLFDDDELDRIVEWARETETGDKAELPFVPGQVWDDICADESCTGKKCRYHQGCFYYAAKKRLEGARLVVCNHALFFTDMKLRLQTGGAAGVLPPASAVIFDEAHHLEDVAVGALGVEVSNFRLPWLARRLRRSDWFQNLGQEEMAEVGKMLVELEQHNHDLFEEVSRLFSEETAVRVDPQALRTSRLIEKLSFLASVVDPNPDEDYMKLSEEEAKRRKLADQVRALRDDLQAISRGDDPNVVVWAEVQARRAENKITLHATPIRVADLLRGALFEAGPIVVMTSATLATAGRFDYLKSRLGVRDALEMVVGSPFDYWNQCLLYVPAHLPEPRDGEYNRLIAREIEEILLKTNGRAFVLFTSYRAMDEVYAQLAPRLRWTVLKQGDMPKGRIVEKFKEDIHSVLFATASFWEGVDVQGEALSCVIMDRLPFSVPTDPVGKARAEAVEAEGKSAFAELSVPEAVIRFKQGFGRLIRSKTDKGLVAVLDKRLITKPYGMKFLRSLPKCRLVHSLENVELFLE